MLYTDAIKYLYELQLFGAKLGLENTFRLAALAGNPQQQLRFIHVAGTNGKGSTCAMLESIYRAAGLRVGLFTSPHLVSFAERIQVNRQMISESDVSRLVTELKGLIERTFVAAGSETCACALGDDGGPLRPTFFEVVTVMAMKYFAEQHCDLVIWETGLGGRLDATNIVTPLASVITNVQFDHQKWLGESLVQIASEKAGIIKSNVPTVTGTDDPDALEVILRTAREKKAATTVIGDTDRAALRQYKLGLLGEHQETNAAVALATVRAVADKIPVPDAAVHAGLQTVDWPGRLQLVRPSQAQTVLLDGAHNPAGAHALANALQKYYPGKKPVLILGIMRDKDWPGMCSILAPVASRIILTAVGSERTADPQMLLQSCREANPQAEISVADGLAAAYRSAAGEPFVVVTGSLYFVGEAMELLQLAPGSAERRLNEWTTGEQVGTRDRK